MPRIDLKAVSPMYTDWSFLWHYSLFRAIKRLTPRPWYLTQIKIIGWPQTDTKKQRQLKSKILFTGSSTVQYNNFAPVSRSIIGIIAKLLQHANYYLELAIRRENRQQRGQGSVESWQPPTMRIAIVNCQLKRLFFLVVANDGSFESPRPPPSICMVDRWSGGPQCL